MKKKWLVSDLSLMKRLAVVRGFVNFNFTLLFYLKFSIVPVLIRIEIFTLNTLFGNCYILQLIWNINGF